MRNIDCGHWSCNNCPDKEKCNILAKTNIGVYLLSVTTILAIGLMVWYVFDILYIFLP
jgi:hypothetical protein